LANLMGGFAGDLVASAVSLGEDVIEVAGIRDELGTPASV
jgi:hypothetical protein